MAQPVTGAKAYGRVPILTSQEGWEATLQLATMDGSGGAEAISGGAQARSGRGTCPPPCPLDPVPGIDSPETLQLAVFTSQDRLVMPCSGSAQNVT